MSIKQAFGYLLLAGPVSLGLLAQSPSHTSRIGQEHAITHHLSDDDEFRIPLLELIDYGKKVFCANWTDQDGAGRPLTKGTGKPISDPSAPLKGARAWNRISGPEANSCAGCHNQPYGIPGGGGDLATGVFVLGQRFDFVTFSSKDNLPTRSALAWTGIRMATAWSTNSLALISPLPPCIRQCYRFRDRLCPMIRKSSAPC
jgi:hypothetical protein